MEKKFKVYQITNTVTGNFYFGQTRATLRKRLTSHKRTADEGSNRPLAVEIRKYGIEKFKIELLFEYNSSKEAAEKEFELIKNGFEKNPEKMLNHSVYIQYLDNASISKMGSGNPNAKKVFAFNIRTKEELEFGAAEDASRFFNLSEHSPVTRRCLNQIKLLLNGEWTFSYTKGVYNYSKVVENYKTTPVRVIDTEKKEEYLFESFTLAEKTLGFPVRTVGRWLERNKDENNILPYKSRYIFKKESAL